MFFQALVTNMPIIEFVFLFSILPSFAILEGFWQVLSEIYFIN